MPIRIDGIVEVDAVEAVVRKLPEVAAFNNPDYIVLIHCMGGQTSGYFRNLWKNDEVKVLWHGWFTRTWWTYFLWFIPGQAGLVKVLDRSKTYDWYEEIGGLSFCGLYFVPCELETKILDAIRNDKYRDLKPEIFRDEKNYFLLSVDFDMHGGERDGEIVYRELIAGDELDADMEALLKLIENISEPELKKIFGAD